MTYDQYWNDNPTLVKYYREAQKIKTQQLNHQLWWQGLYFYEALCDVSPLFQVFAKGQRKPLPYPIEPYPLDQKEKEEAEARQAKAKFDKIKARMEAWSHDVNSKLLPDKETQEDGHND